MSVICQKTDLSRDWALVETWEGRQVGPDEDRRRFNEFLVCLNTLFDATDVFATAGNPEDFPQR